MPGFFTRIYRLAVQGAIYHEVIAPQDGSVVNVGPPEDFLRFFNKQTVFVRYQDGSEVPIPLWFTPDPDPYLHFRAAHWIGLLISNFGKGNRSSVLPKRPATICSWTA